MKKTPPLAPSAFLDRSVKPAEKAVVAALGASAPLWQALRQEAATLFPPLAEAWAYSGKKYGWTLRLSRKDRPVLYMTPCAGYFRASLALSDPAAEAARRAALPKSLLALIEAAPKHPEGRAVRIEVRTKAALKAVIAVAEIRMSL